MQEYFDEEGLLKVIKIFELAEDITKLNWGWDNHSDPVRKAHELMAQGQKLFLEISEYDQRMGALKSAGNRGKILTMPWKIWEN